MFRSFSLLLMACVAGCATAPQSEGSAAGGGPGAGLPAATGSGAKAESAKAESAVPRVVQGNLTTELVPEVPAATREKLDRYLNVRSAELAGWDAAGGGVYVLTRLANVPQLHRVDMPLGMRRQITFGAEGIDVFVPSPSAARGGGIAVADEGGNEYTQLYLLDARGEQRLLTDGKSRNESPVWSDDGVRVAFSSTQRNGRDFDIWTLDVTRPEAAPELAFQADGLWTTLDWSPDGERLLAMHDISETNAELVVLRPGQGVVHAVQAGAAPGSEVAFAGGVFGPGGGGVYYLSDHGGDLRALWYRDLTTGNSRRLSAELGWDFERIVASPDRKLLALTVNEAGWTKLMLYDTAAQRFRSDVSTPRGVIDRLEFSRDGRRLALTVESGRSAGDVHVLDLTRGSLARWTESEAGGLDPARFHEPELIEYASFDGRKIPALVYRPDGAEPRPVVVAVHGGPEGQSRPYFSALNEYLVSELGVAVILPNVRGSTGYGRAYTLLDNADKREDSVKDIGALLDWIAKQPLLDSKRVAVSGGSYGGYMSLATGAMFGERVTAV
ncbi:MAG TPA: alpha/beta fold hydrolase, partial [Polyangiaceae bacterium]|nr:alpha/beta fold hydrolase [Polyangiaceae bacterium]